MSIVYGLKKIHSTLKECLSTLLEQAPEDIADEIIKEKFFSPKEKVFSLIALLVQYNRFKIQDIQHFLTFLRSCTSQEKVRFFEIVSPFLSSKKVKEEANGSNMDSFDALRERS